MSLQEELKKSINSSINVLKQNFSSVHTGRANPDILSPIKAECHGQLMPLNQIASITARDASCLRISVWDKTVVSAVEKAITTSNLNLTPQTAGQEILLNIPPLSEERRKELVKLCNDYAEQVRIAVRNIRKDVLNKLRKDEKNGDISENELQQQEKQIQKIIDETNSNISKLLTEKNQDLLTQ